MDKGWGTVELIRQSGGKAKFVRCNVARAVEGDGLVQQVISRYGDLDIAYNNAGVECQIAAIGDATEADWDRVLSINLKGIWLCMKHELPVMVQQGRGAIVNSSSLVGLVGQRNMASYVASKHGVVGLTRAAALDCMPNTPSAATRFSRPLSTPPCCTATPVAMPSWRQN